MARWLPSLLTLTPVLSVALAAPGPKPKGPSGYYPTSVGAKWVYSDKDGAEEVREVTAAEQVDGAVLVTVRRTDGAGAPFEQVAVSAGRIDRVSVGRFTLGRPYPLLKLPPKAGDAWEFDIKAQPGLLDQAGTLTVGEPEAIAVPAGKFTAVPVVMLVTTQNGNRLAEAQRYTHWYAPDVGLIKFSDPKGRTLVLISFTPSKKE